MTQPRRCSCARFHLSRNNMVGHVTRMWSRSWFPVWQPSGTCSGPGFFASPPVPDARGCRSVRTDPAQLLRPGQDGLHDGLRRGHGRRRHVRHLLLPQVSPEDKRGDDKRLQLKPLRLSLKGRHARPGADGRSREDHDAERGDVRHLHVHRDGHPLLRKPRLLAANGTLPVTPAPLCPPSTV